MGATSNTTNLNLPIFVDDDRPTWRGDFNGAMNILDDYVGKTAVKISGIYNLDEFPGANPSEQFVNAQTTIASTVERATIQVTKDIVLTSPLIWDISVLSIDFTGHTIDASAIVGIPAFQPYNSQTVVTPGNERSLKNFILNGPGRASADSVGIRYYSEVGAMRGLTTENYTISNFETCISFGRNAYLLNFHSGHCFTTSLCMRVEDHDYPTVASNYNYGENIAFNACSFGSCDMVVTVAPNLLVDLNFNGCSFDLLQGGTTPGNGQRVCDIQSGKLNLIACHVEFQGYQDKIPFYVRGANSQVTMIGGLILHGDIALVAMMPALAQCDNPGNDGGMSLVNTALHNIRVGGSDNGGGPLAIVTQQDQFKTQGVIMPGNGYSATGFAGSTTLRSEVDNLIIDPTFSAASHLDFVVTVSTGQTNRTDSVETTLRNVGGKFTINRLTNGAAQISVFVPVQPGKFYSHAFEVASTTCVGFLRNNEFFVACRGTDANGLPIVIKTGVSRGESQWDVASLPGVRKCFNGAVTWNRKAPSWATHYRVDFPLTSLSNAGVITLSKFIAGEM